MSSVVLIVIVNCILIVCIALTSAKPQHLYYRDYKGMGCPDFDSTVTVHLPHPIYCSKYLTCLSKSVIEQSCPGRLHWNIEKNMCDYPDPLKCVDTTMEQYEELSHNRLARRSRNFNVY